jgi:DNA-directed RNA polymerase specialized sigma24 family protein
MVSPMKLLAAYDLYVGNTDRSQVRAAVQELPVDFREVIMLREIGRYKLIIDN